MDWTDEEFVDNIGSALMADSNRAFTGNNVWRLYGIILSQRQEIARHHRDFEQWEDMADKGAQQIERSQLLTRVVTRVGQTRPLCEDMDLNTDGRTCPEFEMYTKDPLSFYCNHCLAAWALEQ